MAKAKAGVQGTIISGSHDTQAAGVPKPDAMARKLVRANAGLKTQFQRVRARISNLRTRGSEAFDELYETVGDVLDSNPPLYVAGGYRNKEDFVAAELPGESLRSVVRNVLVARASRPRTKRATASTSSRRSRSTRRS